MSNDLQLFGHPPSWATISVDEAYRYLLGRAWAPGAHVVFVMLNPSTADAMKDDATIRRCKGFARRWSCGSLQVVNLFAYRARDPKELLTLEDPVGPENDRFIQHALKMADWVVCAWGAHPMAKDRASAVLKLIRDAGFNPLRIGPPTKSGQPRHPLYLRADLAMESHDAACSHQPRSQP